MPTYYNNNYQNVNNNPTEWGLVHDIFPVYCNANMSRHWASGDMTCCVCLNEIVGGNTKIANIACGHVVHLRCLKNWYDFQSQMVTVQPGWRVRLGKTCPICRKVYRTFGKTVVKIED
jgi:hypothetical protein